MVEFVSYDGKYPNLCSGTLVLKIDGEIVKFPKYCMDSGGSCDWRSGIVTEGFWDVHVPPEYSKYTQEILDVVNENVPYGCCGGCI